MAINQLGGGSAALEAKFNAKGDILVAAAKPGYAIVNNEPSAGTIIGKALAAKTDSAPGVVEVAVGRC